LVADGVFLSSGKFPVSKPLNITYVPQEPHWLSWRAQKLYPTLLSDEYVKKKRRFGGDRRDEICHTFVTLRTLSNVT